MTTVVTCLFLLGWHTRAPPVPAVGMGMVKPIGAPQAHGHPSCPMFQVRSQRHKSWPPRTQWGVGVYFGRGKQIKGKTRINVQGSGLWASASLVAPWPVTLA